MTPPANRVECRYRGIEPQLHPPNHVVLGALIWIRRVAGVGSLLSLGALVVAIVYSLVFDYPQPEGRYDDEPVLILTLAGCLVLLAVVYHVVEAHLDGRP